MTTPAGWYDDGQGSLRWWDGNQWTQHTQPLPDAATPAAAEVPASSDHASDSTADASDSTADAGSADVVDPSESAADEPSAPSFDENAVGDAPAVDPVPATPVEPVPAAETEPEAAPETSPEPGPAAPSFDEGAPPSPAPYEQALGQPGEQPSAPAPPQQPYGQEPYAQEPYGAGQQPYAQEPYGQPAAPFDGGQPPARKKSKLWIVFVVVGVVLLALIVGAALLISHFLSAAGSGTSTIGGETGSTDDERAAVATVALYDEAYDTADCDGYDQATTQAYRESIGFTDCAEFQDYSADFADNVTDYTITVTDIETDGDTITIETEETYLLSVDTEGNEIDPPQPAEDDYTYTLVQQDGSWRIDSLD